MKKRIPYIFVLSLLISSFSTLAQERIISESELPFSIREYIATNFKEHKIVKCEEEKNGTSISYQVKLTDFKLEFDSNNKIKEITSKSDLVIPDKLIPASILSYVKTHYAGKGIMEWELKKKKQEVKLNNGLELEFSLDGKFLRIDD